MKKNIGYLLVLLALLAVAYYVYQKDRTEKIPTEERLFSIEDTSSVDRIFLADKRGRTINLVKIDSETWMVNDKFPARIELVRSILQSLRLVQVRNPVSKTLMPTVVKQMAAEAIKVEAYVDGKVVKTYYIGGATKDDTGTYAMLEGADAPYVIHIPGWNGYLSARYEMEEANWRSLIIFDYKESEIDTIGVYYPVSTFASFAAVSMPQGGFGIIDQNSKLVKYDPELAYDFVKGAMRLSAEILDNNVAEKDSVLKSTPTEIIRVVAKDGKSTTIRVYKKFKEAMDKFETNETEIDLDRGYFYHVEADQFGFMQYYVLRGYKKQLADFLYPQAKQ